MQVDVHDEPECKDVNGCEYQEPHKHGYACDKSCTECVGYCHNDCPAQRSFLL